MGEGLMYSYILDGVGEKIIHTGENEPLVVLATSVNTLAPEAYSTLHPTDALKYDWNPLNYSTIKQFYDSDLSTSPAGFKGIITRREDVTKAIKTNYDFREITYRLYSIEQPAWTAQAYSEGDIVQVGSMLYGANATTESTDEPGDSAKWTFIIDITENAFLSYSATSHYVHPFPITIQDTDDYTDRTMFVDDTCSNIVFEECNFIPYVTYGSECGGMTYGSNCGGMTYGSGCYSMTYGSGCNTMTYGSGCYSMTYGSECGGMTYGSGCYSMTYGSGCNTMTYGSYCRTMTYGSSCNNMTYGSGCNTMTYGSNCDTMTYGSYCRTMTYGSGCNTMTYGSNCGYMTYGSNCGNMTYGSYCRTMTYGSSCNTMTYGSNCNTMTYGSNCYSMTYPDFTAYNDFKDGVGNIDFTGVGITQITNGTTITHQLSGLVVYQSYIDASSTPTMVITTNTIGVAD